MSLLRGFSTLSQMPHKMGVSWLELPLFKYILKYTILILTRRYVYDIIYSS